jgi:hypothetical protein
LTGRIRADKGLSLRRVDGKHDNGEGKCQRST